ncbi:Conserved_hypothetical protein [Hexamita inflata]|uniref:EF-hand domain-containing protein n=1 Tax=Hexamita inflata TaxID=28002 RepID=A0AA86U2F4_9EUKA|nr:Conserved hypothetical protein [Hexamita inflata]CAI9937361.1 Conserved hypothetical protein [Hexamita inflata]
MSKQKQTETAHRAYKLGELTYDERKSPNLQAHIHQVFTYIDDAQQNFITCDQFARFLSQTGVVADEQSVYDLVVQFRQSKLEKGAYFEKPPISLQIKESEFRDIVMQKSLPADEIKELKHCFHQLGQITPNLINSQNQLSSTSLFNQMRFWNIMTDQEIELVKVFFGTGGKQTELVDIERFLNGMIE